MSSENQIFDAEVYAQSTTLFVSSPEWLLPECLQLHFLSEAGRVGLWHTIGPKPFRHPEDMDV